MNRNREHFEEYGPDETTPEVTPSRLVEEAMSYEEASPPLHEETRIGAADGEAGLAYNPVVDESANWRELNDDARTDASVAGGTPAGGPTGKGRIKD